MNYTEHSIFVTIINDGSHYKRRCFVAGKSQLTRFTTYTCIVADTIWKGSLKDWWRFEDFTFPEIYAIVQALDEYHQNHLRESVNVS